jgi:hypothetical protein
MTTGDGPPKFDHDAFHLDEPKDDALAAPRENPESHDEPRPARFGGGPRN